MRLKPFLKSKAFVFHLLLISIVLVTGVFLTLKLLGRYTHHDEILVVPSFSGLSESESKVLANQQKLRYKIIDSAFVERAVPGTIIDQHPLAGKGVKRRRTIYLTIAATTPETVSVPWVVDGSLRDAQNRIENAGLRLGQVEYRHSEFMNVVLDQQYIGETIRDTLLIKGSYIDLVVGKGLSNERTQVPNLSGMFFEDAKSALYDVSLMLGAIVFDESFKKSNDSLMARVWKQFPSPERGRNLELGTSVDVWLTVDELKLEEVLEPDTTWMDNESVYIKEKAIDTMALDSTNF